MNINCVYYIIVKVSSKQNVIQYVYFNIKNAYLYDESIILAMIIWLHVE